MEEVRTDTLFAKTDDLVILGTSIINEVTKIVERLFKVSPNMVITVSEAIIENTWPSQYNSIIF